MSKKYVKFTIEMVADMEDQESMAVVRDVVKRIGGKQGKRKMHYMEAPADADMVIDQSIYHYGEPMMEEESAPVPIPLDGVDVIGIASGLSGVNARQNMEQMKRVMDVAKHPRFRRF